MEPKKIEIKKILLIFWRHRVQVLARISQDQLRYWLHEKTKQNT